jgi:hypothetical protein
MIPPFAEEHAVFNSSAIWELVMRTPTAGGAGGKSDTSSASAASSERLPG